MLAARRAEELQPLASDLELTLNCEATLLEFDALQFTQLPGLADAGAGSGGGVRARPPRVRLHGRPGAGTPRPRGDGAHPGDQLHGRGPDSRPPRQLPRGKGKRRDHRRHLGRGGPGGASRTTCTAPPRGGSDCSCRACATGCIPPGSTCSRQSRDSSTRRMTEGLDGLFLVASPDRVAGDILRAWRKRRDVVYTPWFWRWIMLAGAHAAGADLQEAVAVAARGPRRIQFGAARFLRSHRDPAGDGPPRPVSQAPAGGRTAEPTRTRRPTKSMAVFLRSPPGATRNHGPLRTANSQPARQGLLLPARLSSSNPAAARRGRL